MRFLFVCLLSFLSSSSAWASPSFSTIPIQFYYVRTPEVLPYLEAKRAVRHVQGYYRKNFHIDLRVRRFRSVRDFLAPQSNYLSYAQARFISWYDWSEKRRHYGEITHIITGPLLSDQNWFTGGLGYIGCVKTTNLLNFSISYTTLFNPDRHSRFVAAKGAIAHEIGHNLGAHHVEDCSLMDTNLNYCMGDAPSRVTPPSKKSFKEIRDCVN